MPMPSSFVAASPPNGSVSASGVVVVIASLQVVPGVTRGVSPRRAVEATWGAGVAAGLCGKAGQSARLPGQLCACLYDGARRHRFGDSAGAPRRLSGWRSRMKPRQPHPYKQNKQMGNCASQPPKPNLVVWLSGEGLPPRRQPTAPTAGASCGAGRPPAWRDELVIYRAMVIIAALLRRLGP